ncbi:MAG: peptidoglycan DD-metalloendopeptidase family protein [Eubacterium sp.]|nr:peptidoglycan DD-metalloendopeptidase family protein [Eubacterium sp.]
MKKNKILVLIMVFALIISSCYQDRSLATGDVDKKIAKEEKKSKAYSKKSESAEKKASKAKSKKEKALKAINKINRKIAKLEENIQLMDQDLEKQEKELKKQEAALEEAQAEEDEKYETMKRRIRYMYENGNQDYIDIIFSAKGLSDLLNSAEYVEKISAYDKNIFDSYQAVKMSVDSQTNAIADKLAAIEVNKQALKEDKYDLELLRESKKAEVEEYLRIENRNTKLAKAAAKEAQKAEEKINKLLAEKARELEASGDDAGVEVSASGLRWPLRISGRISSYFGRRKSPTAGASSYHKGIDLAVPTGTPIVASAAGKVVIAQYSSSAGNYIMLSHGKRLYTVYMHCSRLAVEVGDQVEQGDIIGYVGSTGISTGSHLHFGISIDGEYVNPLKYVTKP